MKHTTTPDQQIQQAIIVIAVTVMVDRAKVQALVMLVWSPVVVLVLQVTILILLTLITPADLKRDPATFP